MSTLSERMAKLNAATKPAEPQKQTQRRYLPGGISFEVMPTDFELAVQGELGQIATGVAKMPYKALHDMRQGRADKLMYDISQTPYVGTGAAPAYTYRTELPKAIPMSDFERDGVVAKKTRAWLEENPELDDTVTSIGSGLEGAPGTKHAAIEAMFAPTPYQAKLMSEWEQSDPLGEGFWKFGPNLIKLMISQTDSLALSAIPVAGWYTMEHMMYDENMRRMKTQFEKNGFEFDANDPRYQEIAHLFATVGMAGEVTGSILTGGSALGKSVLKPFIKGVPPSLLKATGSTVANIGLTAIGEGGAEAHQSFMGDLSVNRALELYAQDNNVENYQRVTAAEMRQNAKDSFAMGAWVGGGFAGVGAPRNFRNNYKKAQFDKAVSEIQKELKKQEDNQSETVKAVGTLTEETVAPAIKATDLELKRDLDSMEGGELIELAKEMGFDDSQVAEGDYKAYSDFIFSQRQEIEGYTHAVHQKAVEALDTKDKTFETHAAKWMVDGDITAYQMDQMKILMDGAARNLGYAGIDQYLKEVMDFKRDNMHDVIDSFDDPQIIKDAQATAEAATLRESFVGGFLGQVTDYLSSRDIHKLITVYNKDNGYWRPSEGVGEAGSPDTASHETMHGVLDQGYRLGEGGLFYDLIKVLEDNKMVLDVDYKGLTGEDAVNKFWDDMFRWVDQNYSPGYATRMRDQWGWNSIQAKDWSFQEMIAMLMSERDPRMTTEVTRQAREIVEAFLGPQMLEILDNPEFKARTEFKPDFQADMDVMKVKIKELLDLAANLEADSNGRLGWQPSQAYQAQYDKYKFDTFSTAMGGMPYEEIELALGGYGPSVLDNGVFMEFPNELAAIDRLSREVKDLWEKHTDRTDMIMRFYQMGRKLKSGAQVIRGETTVNPEGKFLIRLFKTGDITTLAHEFMHVATPKMGPELQKELIKEYVAETFSELDAKEKTAKEAEVLRMFHTYRVNPGQFRNRSTVEGVRQMNDFAEYIAETFESYLATQTAATPQLREFYDIFAKLYSDYYTEIREMPAEYNNVPDRLAKLFDNFLAGSRAIPRMIDREISLPDPETGKKKRYRILQSRPQIKMHRSMLKFLRRALADEVRLHEYLGEYTNVILEGIPLGGKFTDITRKDLQNRIEAVDSNKKAIEYLRYVDNILVKYERSQHKEALENVRKVIQEGLKKPADPGKRFSAGRIVKQGIKDAGLRDIFQDLADQFDLGDRGRKRVKKALDLIKHHPLDILNMTNAELMLEGIDPKDVQLMRDIEKRNVADLTTDQLRFLAKQLNDIIKYDNFQEDSFIAKRAELDGERRSQFLTEYNKSARAYARRQKSKMPLWARKATKGLRDIPSSWRHQLRNLEALALDIPVIGEVADQIREGFYKRAAQRKKYTDALTTFVAQTPLNGVSKTLGNVTENDMIEIEVYDAEQLVEIPKKKPRLEKRHPDVEGFAAPLLDPYRKTREDFVQQFSDESRKAAKTTVKVTLGEIMMWYGYSKNEDATRHLLEGGFRMRRPGDPDINDKLYRFIAPEGLKTAIAQLDPDLMKVVDDIMGYYDETVRVDINDISLQMVGYGIADVDNYLPLFVENQERNASEIHTLAELRPGGKSYARQRLAHLGFTNQRVGSSKPLYAYDIFEGVGRNLEQVVEYTAMVKPMRDARALLLDPTGADGGTKAKMRTLLGDEQLKRLEEWLDRIEDPAYRTSSREESRVNKMIAASKKGILKWNLSVMALQPSSAMLAITEGVSVVNLTKAMANPTRLVVPKYGMADLSEMAPWLWERYTQAPTLPTLDQWGGKSYTKYFVGGTLRDTQQRFHEARNATELFQAMAQLEDQQMWTIRHFDAVALSYILDAIQMEGLSEVETMTKFRRVVEKTQPQNDVIFTSNFYSTKNAFFRHVFGAFRSQRDVILGGIQTNLMNIQNAAYEVQYAKAKGVGIKEAKKKRNKVVAKSVWNIAYLGFISQMIVQAIRDAFGKIGDDKDDEDYDPLEPAGNEAVEFLGRTTLGSLSLLPFIGDISKGVVDYTKFGDFSPFSLIPIEQAGRAFNKIERGIKKTNEGYPEEGTELIIDGLSVFTSMAGLSSGNVYRWWRRIEKQWLD